MKILKIVLSTSLFILLLFIPQEGICDPGKMQIYNNDKFARPAMKNKCSVCHVSPSGGGPENAFGMAFQSNGFKITDDLRQKFPELFDLAQSLKPKIIRVKPVSLMVGQESKLSIIGLNLTANSIIFIDGEESTISSTFVNSKNIEIVITFDSPGKHTIQLQASDDQKSNIFKVLVKPVKKAL